MIHLVNVAKVFLGDMFSPVAKGYQIVEVWNPGKRLWGSSMAMMAVMAVMSAM